MREEKDCITCKKKNSKTKDLGVDMARNGRNRVLFFETSRDNGNQLWSMLVMFLLNAQLYANQGTVTV